MKYFLTITIYLSLLPLLLFSQPDSAQIYFNQASKLMKEQKLDDAESLLTHSIRLFPKRNAYFNRAICKRDMGNLAGYCDDMAKAALFGDADAVRLIIDDCKMDTSFILTSISEKRNTIQEKLDKPEQIKVNSVPEKIHYRYDANTIDFAENEKMPKFPGGEKKLIEYLSKNIQYPIKARNKGIQGKVHLKFMVNANGYVSDIRPVKEYDPHLLKEAIRIISEMPRWDPASIDGIPVAVEFYMPIQFSLQ